MSSQDQRQNFNPPSQQPQQEKKPLYSRYTDVPNNNQPPQNPPRNEQLDPRDQKYRQSNFPLREPNQRDSGFQNSRPLKYFDRQPIQDDFQVPSQQELNRGHGFDMQDKFGFRRPTSPQPGKLLDYQSQQPPNSFIPRYQNPQPFDRRMPPRQQYEDELYNEFPPQHYHNIRQPEQFERRGGGYERGGYQGEDPQQLERMRGLGGRVPPPNMEFNNRPPLFNDRERYPMPMRPGQDPYQTPFQDRRGGEYQRPPPEFLPQEMQPQVMKSLQNSASRKLRNDYVGNENRIPMDPTRMQEGPQKHFQSREKRVQILGGHPDDRGLERLGQYPLDDAFGPRPPLQSRYGQYPPEKRVGQFPPERRFGQYPPDRDSFYPPELQSEKYAARPQTHQFNMPERRPFNHVNEPLERGERFGPNVDPRLERASFIHPQERGGYGGNFSKDRRRITMPPELERLENMRQGRFPPEDERMFGTQQQQQQQQQKQFYYDQRPQTDSLQQRQQLYRDDLNDRAPNPQERRGFRQGPPPQEFMQGPPRDGMRREGGNYPPEPFLQHERIPGRNQQERPNTDEEPFDRSGMRGPMKYFEPKFYQRGGVQEGLRI